MENQEPISKPETAAPTRDVVGVDVPPLVRRCDTCRHFRLDTEKDGHKWGVCTWDAPVPDHYKKRDEFKMSILSVACGSLAFGEDCKAWQNSAPMDDRYTIEAFKAATNTIMSALVRKWEAEGTRCGEEGRNSDDAWDDDGDEWRERRSVYFECAEELKAALRKFSSPNAELSDRHE